MSARKRLFKTTYSWRARYDDTTRMSGELCVSADTMFDAVRRTTRIGKASCKRDGDVFLRVRSVEDCGVLRE